MDAQAALGDTTFGAAFDQGFRFTLDEAVGHVLDGRRGTPSVPAPRLAGPAHAPLTRREQQVAQLVAEGLSNSDIAARSVAWQAGLYGATGQASRNATHDPILTLFGAGGDCGVGVYLKPTQEVTRSR